MPRTKRHPALRVTAVAVVAALVASVSGFLIYAETTYAATPAPVQAIADDPAIAVEWTYDHVVMTPSDPAAQNGAGLVFLAGAKVDPLAYASKLSGLVDDGTTVVIVRPVLNFAIFEFRPFSDFTALAPASAGVTDWFVGGHSLGGVKACQYAADADAGARGLVLLGSYCAGDESGLAKPVLSVSASNDGLSTPEKIDASKPDLPADTVYVVLDGATHAQFGDYGLQPGDGTSTVDDTTVRRELAAALTAFIP